MDGILLVDKPVGPTSNQVVQTVRRALHRVKVGHSGTLDPMASGLMVLLLGAGSKALDYLEEKHKQYWMKVELGVETDTDDRQGTVQRTEDTAGVTEHHVRTALLHYKGVMEQVPPRYSAIKRNGVPMYKLARQGVEIEQRARTVEIVSLDLLNWSPPFVELNLLCSRGTYARSVARDLGRDLGVGGTLAGLRRAASGRFTIQQAVPLAEIENNGPEVVRANLIDLPAALHHIPTVPTREDEVRRLSNGTSATVPVQRLGSLVEELATAQPLAKVISRDRSRMILVAPRPKGMDVSLKPVKVFAMNTS